MGTEGTSYSHRYAKVKTDGKEGVCPEYGMWRTGPAY